MTKNDYCAESADIFGVLIVQFGRPQAVIAVYVVDELGAELFLTAFLVDLLLRRPWWIRICHTHP